MDSEVRYPAAIRMDVLPDPMGRKHSIALHGQQVQYLVGLIAQSLSTTNARQRDHLIP